MAPTVRLTDETGSDPNIRLVDPPRRSNLTDEIRIFDGKNSPQNISAYGFLLGMVCSAGIMYAYNAKTEMPHFGIFLSALALFHFLEYIATALFNPDKLTLDCKVDLNVFKCIYVFIYLHVVIISLLDQSQSTLSCRSCCRLD
jgi:hypothetical protein